MKTLILLTGIALFSSAFVGEKSRSSNTKVITVKAVNQPFAYFRVHRMANDASLNWGITNPLEVNKFTIKYSYDNSWWLDYDNNGIMCNGAATHRHRIPALPGTTYYKIVAEMMDGSVMESPVETLRIVKRG
jgi:hypothetical protein